MFATSETRRSIFGPSFLFSLSFRAGGNVENIRVEWKKVKFKEREKEKGKEGEREREREHQRKTMHDDL